MKGTQAYLYLHYKLQLISAWTCVHQSSGVTLCLSGAKDNNTRETLDGDPRRDGGTADDSGDTNKMEKKIK